MKWLMVLAVIACGVAHAAKVPVSWINPTMNTAECSGTPVVCKPETALTDLTSVKIEWGTCNGTAFGTYQASITIKTTVAGAAVRSFIYPTGIKKVCVRAFAINSHGNVSDSSGVAASGDLLPTTSKPVTLGKPVILNFINPED